jgi:hypothetical protein
MARDDVRPITPHDFPRIVAAIRALLPLVEAAPRRLSEPQAEERLGDIHEKMSELKCLLNPSCRRNPDDSCPEIEDSELGPETKERLHELWAYLIAFGARQRLVGEPVFRRSFVAALGEVIRLEEAPEGRSEQIPTRAHCLAPPNKVRWKDEETHIQQRLWHLLGLLLDRLHAPDAAVSFEDAEEALAPGKGRSSKSTANDVGELNRALLEINFPWEFATKGQHIIRSR